MNKKTKKHIGILVLLLLALSSLFSGFAVKIQADSVTSEATIENLAGNSDYFIPSLVPQQELLQQKLENAIVVSEEDGNEVATISDAAMIQALQSSGFQVEPEIVRASMMRGAGVTKLVWYGNKKAGNFNIYISVNVLKAIKYASAAFNVFMAAFQAYLGNFIGSAMNMLKATVNIIKASIIKNGKVYYARSWGYGGSGAQ